MTGCGRFPSRLMSSVVPRWETHLLPLHQQDKRPDVPPPLPLPLLAPVSTGGESTGSRGSQLRPKRRTVPTLMPVLLCSRAGTIFVRTLLPLLLPLRRHLCSVHHAM